MKKITIGPKVRFLVFSGEVSFRTTASQIRNGIGGYGKFNAAIQKALNAMEYDGMQGIAVSGIAGTWEGVPVQLTRL
jgi:hypothetical protein